MPPLPYRRTAAGHRRGGALIWLVLLLAMAGGGAWWWSRLAEANASTGGDADVVYHTVDRQDFSLEVTERGEVQSAGGVEVKSEVKSMNSTGISILRIVPEGTTVSEGDFLVELDSSSLENDRLIQQINVNTAQATVVEAQNLYETAVIAREEYLEGVFVQERQTIQSEVFVAEENLSRAEEYLEYSRRLGAKGYVSDLQLEADRFAVEKSRKELEAAQTKLRVLEEFTKAKTLKQLDSDVLIAKAKWDSVQNSYQLEVDKLQDIEDQIAKCVIIAPSSGTVKYAHGGDNQRGGDEFVVEEGAVIRERQAIINLPDATKMEVSVEVNESLVQHVREGMPAAVRLVGAGDEVLSGHVARVNQYAEPSNWRRANVKDYKAFIAIDEASDLVRSGMTASVTISSMAVDDAILAPVQSVYAHGDGLFCFVERGDGLEAQPIAVGPTNDRFFVVESGLGEGDRIAMNPRRLADRVDLPEIMPEQVQQAVDSGGDWRALQQRKTEATAEKPAAEEAKPTEGTTAATRDRATSSPASS